MDSIDRLLDALDKCHNTRAEIGTTAKVPSTLIAAERARNFAEAKDELRAGLSAVIVEAVRADCLGNGSLRALLLTELTGREIRDGEPSASAEINFRIPATADSSRGQA